MVCGCGPGRRPALISAVWQADSVRGKLTTTGSETAMRALIIMLLVIAAALLGETQAGNAQSPYSYPWCAIPSGGDNSGGGAMSCYYTSWQQ